jgi:hypothetical protein
MSEQRPLFSTIGRKDTGGPRDRSPAVMLLVVLGLVAATITLVWEQVTNVHYRFVEVSWMPDEAAAAEAQVKAAAAQAAVPAEKGESQP